MAEIKIRHKKDGTKSYTVCIRIVGAPPIYKTFSRKTDALEWQERTQSEIRENMNFPKRKAQKYTVADIIDLFIENELPKKKPSAQAEFKMVLNWYKKEIGKYYLSNVDNQMLINCRDKLAKKHKEIPIKGQKARETDKTLSNATINKYMTYMRVVFEYCVSDLDILQINPMSKVKKLKVDNARKRCLEQKEITKLLDNALKTDYELYLCILIALLTGARKSEVLHLTWSDVDFEHKMFYFMETKNGTDRGTPMHDILFDELTKFKNQSKVRHINKNDYLFATSEGKPREFLIGKMFPKLVKQCGIEDFRFHDLRHTQASWQAMGGISQVMTQKTLGHKSPAMTNRYSHLRDENLRPTINNIGNTMLGDWLKHQTNG